MVFRSLSKEQIKDIVDLELDRVQAQLTEQNVKLDVSEEVKGYIAEEGYDSDYGARPLRRVIQDSLEDRLSEALLSRRVQTRRYGEGYARREQGVVVAACVACFSGRQDRGSRSAAWLSPTL